MELVTGYAGKPHINPAQDGAFHAGIVGSGSYVFNTGGKLSASVITNNLIRILDGDILANGRHITIARGTYEEVEIANGLQGVKRNDLICARYEKNADSGIESASLVVIQGTSTEGTPVDPEYNDNNILDGTLISDFPLYRIRLDGLNVSEPEQLFTVIKNINEIQGEVASIQKNVETIEIDIDALNHNLSNKQNLLNKGTFAGNIDTDVPINSIVWCDSASVTGDIPVNGFFQLHNFSSSDGLHYQMAVFYNNNNAPLIYGRLYCNGVWSKWGQLQDKIPSSISFWDNGVHIIYNDGGYAIQNDNRMWRFHANGTLAWIHEFNPAGDTVLHSYTFSDGDFSVDGELIDGKGNKLSDISTTHTAIIANSDSDLDISQLVVQKRSGIVTINGVMKYHASLPADSWCHFFTLPEGYLPSNDLRVNVSVTNHSKTQGLLWADGRFCCLFHSENYLADDDIRFNLSYPSK